MDEGMQPAQATSAQDAAGAAAVPANPSPAAVPASPAREARPQDDESAELKEALKEIAHAFGTTISGDGDERDMIDELMDIEKGLQSVSNPFASITQALMEDPAKRRVWNPGDYKAKPHANTMRCMRIMAESKSDCSACLDVCPEVAISIEGQVIRISDDCRKCGLCLSVCPTEVFTETMHLAKKLYDNIARAAAIHDQCYITCTRALGRLPQANEIVLPCVGALAPEVLFACLADYPNLSVYLPMGVCDRCQTVTGEQVLMDNIAKAEAWSGRSVGIAMDEDELTHDRKRSYERSEFLKRYAQIGTTAILGATNPVLAGAQAVSKRISEHAARINAIERQLDAIVGNSNAQKKRRTITPRRQLLLGAIQAHPRLASRVDAQVPVCDSSLCTMCGVCTRVCPTYAIDMDNDGHFGVATSYCVGCGACVAACEEQALSMGPADISELVLPKGEGLTTAQQTEKLDAALEKLKAEALRKVEGLMGGGEAAAAAPAATDTTPAGDIAAPASVTSTVPEEGKE